MKVSIFVGAGTRALIKGRIGGWRRGRVSLTLGPAGTVIHHGEKQKAREEINNNCISWRLDAAGELLGQASE